MLRLLKPSLITLLLLASAPALACRDAFHSHEQRLAESDVALVARVSGVLVPLLERPEIRDNINAGIAGVLADHTVRLAVIQSLKGQSQSVILVDVTQCNGSVYAEIGAKVYAYRFGTSWHLVGTPPVQAPENAGAGDES